MIIALIQIVPPPVPPPSPPGLSIDYGLIFLIVIGVVYGCLLKKELPKNSSY